MENIVKKYIWIILAGMTFMFSGCEDQLELTPAQSIDQELALNSDANVKTVLVGAYDELSASTLYGGNVLLLSEMLAANNEIRWQGTFNQPREVYNKNIFLTNSYVTNMWLDAYNAINISNNVLSALDVVNEEDRNRVRAEALFIRGALYFELVRFFSRPYVAGGTSSAPGVPLILVPTREINEDSYVSRNTVEETYAQVLADLTEAESLLPGANGFFATNYAASALLSRVYLQMERYADARDAANRAIQNALADNKALVGTYAGAFNNEANTSEDLFAIQVSAQDGSNNMHLFYSIPTFGGRDGDVVPLSRHMELYEEGDARLDLYYEGAGDLRIGKWRDQYMNVKIIRLAEMYLTRAEANFREGTEVGDTPENDINLIRVRVNLPEKTSLTLDDILLERKLELAHEGHAIHDAKRIGGSIEDNNSTVVYPFDSPNLVFPIPQREMDANPALEQNPGYGG